VVASSARRRLAGWDYRLDEWNAHSVLSQQSLSFSTIPTRPKILTRAEDHAADDWRYACMSRPRVPVAREQPADVGTGYRAVQDDLPADESLKTL
jgi:hypothetical protein